MNVYTTVLVLTFTKTSFLVHSSTGGKTKTHPHLTHTHQIGLQQILNIHNNKQNL